MTGIERYKMLKKENPNTIYLFKQGIFYRAYDEDAKLLNSKIGLKLLDSGFGYLWISCKKYKYIYRIF